MPYQGHQPPPPGPPPPRPASSAWQQQQHDHAGPSRWPDHHPAPSGSYYAPGRSYPSSLSYSNVSTSSLPHLRIQQPSPLAPPPRSLKRSFDDDSAGQWQDWSATSSETQTSSVGIFVSRDAPRSSWLRINGLPPRTTASCLYRSLASLPDPHFEERSMRSRLARVAVLVSRQGTQPRAKGEAIVTCKDESAAAEVLKAIEVAGELQRLPCPPTNAKASAAYLDPGTLLLQRQIEALPSSADGLQRSIVDADGQQWLSRAYEVLLNVWDGQKDDREGGQNVDSTGTRTDVASDVTAQQSPPTSTPLTTTENDAKAAASRRVPTLPTSKKTAKLITRWNEKKEELVAPAAEEVPAKKLRSTSPFDAPDDGLSPPPRPDCPGDFDFSDAIKKACLLCQRQFKTLDTLSRHAKESELHRTNLADVSVRNAGRERVEGAKSDVSAQAGSTTSDASKYRDRALERRAIFGREDLKGASSTARTVEAPEAVAPPPQPLHAGGIGASNEGHKLLLKMGWKEGSGLGASGEGRTDNVQAEMYAKGFGLGSRGAKVGSAEEGREKSYMEHARDATVRRYQREEER